MATYVGKIKADGTNELPIASTLYGTCSTAAATAAKVVTCANFDKLITGVALYVKFTYANTASNPTLNVNSTGAKSIIGALNYAEGSWDVANSSGIVCFVYDGTSWRKVGWGINDFVSQRNSTQNVSRPLLFSMKADVTTTTNTWADTLYSNKFYVNPSTGILTASEFSGLGVLHYRMADISIATTDWGAETGGRYSYEIDLSTTPDKFRSDLYLYDFGDEDIIFVPATTGAQKTFMNNGVTAVNGGGGYVTIYTYFKPSSKLKCTIRTLSTNRGTNVGDVFNLCTSNTLMATYGSDTYNDVKKAYDNGYTIHLRRQYSTNYPTTTLTCVGYNATYCYFWGMCPSTATQPVPYRFLNVYVSSANAWSQSISSF